MRKKNKVFLALDEFVVFVRSDCPMCQEASPESAPPMKVMMFVLESCAKEPRDKSRVQPKEIYI